MPSEHSTPQLAIGADTPRPIKLKKASVKIASGIDILSETIITPIAFGIRCLNNILPEPAPMLLDAKTNSCSLWRLYENSSDTLFITY